MEICNLNLQSYITNVTFITKVHISQRFIYKCYSQQVYMAAFIDPAKIGNKSLFQHKQQVYMSLLRMGDY